MKARAPKYLVVETCMAYGSGIPSPSGKRPKKDIQNTTAS
jgi:hypothetical protein